MGRAPLLKPLPRFPQACVAEFLGTYFFVLIIAGAIVHAGDFAPIAIGFALTFLVYAYGYVSKAQLNPAVSLGLFIAGIQDFKCSLTFIFIQLIAAVLGALTALGLLLDSDSFKAPRPYDDSRIAQARAFFVELLFTVALAHTMINVAVSRQGGNSHFGLAIGLTVLCGAFAFGPVSGASFNPAVTFGLQIVQLYGRGSAGRRPIYYIWLYWIAEFVGGVIAGFIFQLFDESKKGKDSPEEYGENDDKKPGAETTGVGKSKDKKPADASDEPYGKTGEENASRGHVSINMPNSSGPGAERG